MIVAKRLTYQDFAHALGVTPQTVKNYRSRGCTAETIEEMQAWCDENIQSSGVRLGERVNGNRKRAVSELDEAEQRAKIAKLEEEQRKLRLANDEREGRTVDIEAVELQVSELTGMIRARMEAIPNELEPEWPAEVRALVTERMKDKLNLILTEMSQWRLEQGDGE